MDSLDETGLSLRTQTVHGRCIVSPGYAEGAYSMGNQRCPEKKTGRADQMRIGHVARGLFPNLSG